MQAWNRSPTSGTRHKCPPTESGTVVSLAPATNNRWHGLVSDVGHSAQDIPTSACRQRCSWQQEQGFPNARESGPRFHFPASSLEDIQKRQPRPRIRRFVSPLSVRALLSQPCPSCQFASAGYGTNLFRYEAPGPQLEIFPQKPSANVGQRLPDAASCSWTTDRKSTRLNSSHA